jgi:hypothetical protein
MWKDVGRGKKQDALSGREKPAAYMNGPAKKKVKRLPNSNFFRKYSHLIKSKHCEKWTYCRVDMWSFSFRSPILAILKEWLAEKARFINSGCIELRKVEKVTYLIMYKNPITFNGMLNIGKKEHVLSY